MNATYTKLRTGAWGVRVQSELPPMVGQTIFVSTKAGATKSERVSSIVWSGGGVFLCSIAASTPAPSSQRRYSGGGSAPNVPGYSSYCTGRSGCRCFDCE
jgi:hypothetical protein